MKYRHECKYEITYADMLVLRQRLGAVAKHDIHAVNGTYLIRSLYFDDDLDRALREKRDGVNVREKFRIRFYNLDTGIIHLEKKSKRNGLCRKETAELTERQAQAIVCGRLDWMRASGNPLIEELYCKMRGEGLRPKIIVDYMREPFVFAPGNVRVTLDYDIRTGFACANFLRSDCVMIPAGEAPRILEVKWDEFLPDIIRDAVQIRHCRLGAYSKYAAGRIYG